MGVFDCPQYYSVCPPYFFYHHKSILSLTQHIHPKKLYSNGNLHPHIKIDLYHQLSLQKLKMLLLSYWVKNMEKSKEIEIIEHITYVQNKSLIDKNSLIFTFESICIHIHSTSLAKSPIIPAEFLWLLQLWAAATSAIILPKKKICTLFLKFNHPYRSTPGNKSLIWDKKT